MVFNWRTNPRDIFTYGGKVFGVANSFKYLGIEFNTSGKFFKGKKTTLLFIAVGKKSRPTRASLFLSFIKQWYRQFYFTVVKYENMRT